MLLTVPLGVGVLVAVLAQAASFKHLEWPLDWSNWENLLQPEVRLSHYFFHFGF